MQHLESLKTISIKNKQKINNTIIRAKRDSSNVIANRDSPNVIANRDSSPVIANRARRNWGKVRNAIKNLAVIRNLDGFSDCQTHTGYSESKFNFYENTCYINHENCFIQFLIIIRYLVMMYYLISVNSVISHEDQSIYKMQNQMLASLDIFVFLQTIITLFVSIPKNSYSSKIITKKSKIFKHFAKKKFYLNIPYTLIILIPFYLIDNRYFIIKLLYICEINDYTDFINKM